MSLWIWKLEAVFCKYILYPSLVVVVVVDGRSRSILALERVARRIHHSLTRHRRPDDFCSDTSEARRLLKDSRYD